MINGTHRKLCIQGWVIVTQAEYHEHEAVRLNYLLSDRKKTKPETVLTCKYVFLWNNYEFHTSAIQVQYLVALALK